MPDTLTPPKERLDGGIRTGREDPVRVIVLDDNHNTFDGVAAALSYVIPGMTYERGKKLADKIHNTGKAVVWSGHRELAELYWQQLKDRGLTMDSLKR